MASGRRCKEIAGEEVEEGVEVAAVLQFYKGEVLQ